MNITERVKTFSNFPAGVALDTRIAKALKWKCPEKCRMLERCLHIPSWSRNIKDAFTLRFEMKKLGWKSEDQLTDLGWGEDKNGHKWGYGFWFKKWDPDYIEYVAVCHSGNLNEIPLVIARSALLALEAKDDCCVGNKEHILKSLKSSFKT